MDNSVSSLLTNNSDIEILQERIGNIKLNDPKMKSDETETQTNASNCSSTVNKGKKTEERSLSSKPARASKVRVYAPKFVSSKNKSPTSIKALTFNDDDDDLSVEQSDKVTVAKPLATAKRTYTRKVPSNNKDGTADAVGNSSRTVKSRKPVPVVSISKSKIRQAEAAPQGDVLKKENNKSKVVVETLTSTRSSSSRVTRSRNLGSS